MLHTFKNIDRCRIENIRYIDAFARIQYLLQESQKCVTSENNSKA